MEPNLLIEYRCACGKLLFKGALFISTIEIKCRRCGKVEVFSADEAGSKISFALFINNGGEIIDSCFATSLAGLERNYTIGRHVSELFPLLRDAPKFDGKYFDIKHNILLLRDGKRVSCESSFIPYDNAYRIFNIFSRVV